MDDSLPIQLFSLKNSLTLHQFGKTTLAGYFLPGTHLITAINSESIQIDERIGLLEVSLEYIKIINDISSQSEELLPDNRYNNKTVRIFSNLIQIEGMNTIHSIIQIISSMTGLISLNRLSSNPLEHYFGLIRMRARYDHTYQLISDSQKIELLRRIRNEIGLNQPISGRKKTFGKIISVSSQIDPNKINPYD